MRARSAEVREARATFENVRDELAAGRRVVFIDETGFHTGMGRRFGRAPVGEVVVLYNKPMRAKSLSMVGALTIEGVLSSMVVEGSVDGDAFLAWCEKGLCPMLERGDLVVMDNLSVHHMDRIVATIEGTGATVCFLPPYSPDFNPIELCWAWLKKRVRDRAPRDVPSLIGSIGNAINIVTQQLAQSWIASCGW